MRLFTVLTVGLLCAVLGWQYATASGPEPTASAPATPALTPVGPDEIRVRVVHDLDRDLRADHIEPGVAGWTIAVGCRDRGLRHQDFVFAHTDHNGYTTVSITPISGDTNALICLQLEHRRNWLEEISYYQRLPVDYDRQQTFEYFVHDFGPTVMELRGDAYDGGLPMSSPRFSKNTPPFDGKGKGCLEQGTVLIIVGANLRDGCPDSGDDFEVILNGQVASRFTFVPGTEDRSDFAINGDSMRLFTTNVDGARIDGVDCAVIRNGDYDPTRDLRSVAVYVLSQDVRTGCGAPGRLVTFYFRREPLVPVLEWRSGFVPLAGSFSRAPPPSTQAPLPLQPPDTGSAGLLR